MNSHHSKTSLAHSIRSAGTFASISKDDEHYHTTPEFIYGGPFINVEKPSPFINSATPINLQLQGTFKKSFAFYSLKERLPIILTKVIDYVSREGGKIRSAHSASDDDLKKFIQSVAKLKNDLVTNKPYELFTVDTEEGKKWNQWIGELDNTRYFNNVWLFSECYVYRKLREACELSKGLYDFDPFEAQKGKAFEDNVELMCLVAERVAAMLPPADRDRRKADFVALLKMCLWANRCDLSLGDSAAVHGAAPLDPFQMIVDCKDKLLVDDSGKIADQVVSKAESVAKAIEGNTTFKSKCSCQRLAAAAGLPPLGREEPPAPVKGSKGGSPPATPAEPAAPAEPEELPKIPCPAKLTIPQAVMFDIVCDNTGYELFADLCLAHFLVAQKIVQKVRFHLKKYPWFVSDVTPRDFKRVIDGCAGCTHRRELAPPTTSEAAPGGEPEPARVVSADALRQLAEQWRRFVDDGVFVPLADPYWTYPHAYKDMKKYDPNMYRKLQYAVAILFKGDLNYRKLLAERNCNPAQAFELSLQGFTPAPIIAARTVKCDLICGLPRGKWEALTKADEQWMTTGEYGVIQYCPKAEPLKPSDRPCADYGDTCRGLVCPEHKDM